ncbi:reverse transcriptase [Gossypium australe]|uniref:Reverse transcriptase n=1 Tax=Gossypium australe TaxID=47621 RepID=A0A5B6WPM6_9ROSI|nr:reverse transcriptase [Gossypium australe]
MENELAGLSLDEEEDVILQIQTERTEERRAEVFSMDLERVLKGCPWTFNNHLLVLHTIQWGEDPLRIPLIKAPFWIQIHDIPIGFFSENLAIQLGNFIGEFMEYNGSNLSKENRNYMRIRVKIDVRRPLKRRKQILCYGKFSYVKFRYERLSLFCFFCGRLGHNDSFCDAKTMLGTEVAEMGWDLSLRAQSMRAVTIDIKQDKEDGVLIGEEGKKHARGEIGNMIVVGDEKTTAGRNRRALKGNQFILAVAKRRADGRNETVELERSWIVESTNSSKTSVYAEVTKSPNCLLHGDEDL